MHKIIVIISKLILINVVWKKKSLPNKYLNNQGKHLNLNYLSYDQQVNHHIPKVLIVPIYQHYHY